LGWCCDEGFSKAVQGVFAADPRKRHNRFYNAGYWAEIHQHYKAELYGNDIGNSSYYIMILVEGVAASHAFFHLVA